MRIISAILILVTIYFNFKHGWSGLTSNMNPEQLKMMDDLGIGKTWLTIVSICCLSICVLVIFPQTFFIGNVLNAAVILFIMALALQANQLKVALIEIPFLLMPLCMIWLGHPFKNGCNIQ